MPDLLPEIHWDDGLLLRPQHLQAFQRHCVGLVSQLSLSRTFGYGVRRLKIREESIGNWIFEVNACDLVMPDGSVIFSEYSPSFAGVNVNRPRPSCSLRNLATFLPS